MEHEYYWDLAAAFVRGHLGIESNEANPQSLIALGKSRGLRLHKFKTTNLPRVQKVLGILRAIRPETLIDIGSGRGAFLWPMLDAFPNQSVTAVDVNPIRVRDYEAVTRGGISNLKGICADAQEALGAVQPPDVITALEVLEHLENPYLATRNLLALRPRFLLVSVPSKPDSNPEHIHFFTPPQLSQLLSEAGAKRIKLQFVPGHTIAVAQSDKKTP